MDSPEFINPFKQFYILGIPEPVASYRGLSPGAKLVYGRLQRYAGRKGVAFPHIPELAEEVGLGERQTREYISELVETKFIHRERQFAKGNTYRFLNHPCFSGKDIGQPRSNSTAFLIGGMPPDSDDRLIGGMPPNTNRRDAASQEAVYPYCVKRVSIKRVNEESDTPSTVKEKSENTLPESPADSSLSPWAGIPPERIILSRFKRESVKINPYGKAKLKEWVRSESCPDPDRIYESLDRFFADDSWKEYRFPLEAFKKTFDGNRTLHSKANPRPHTAPGCSSPSLASVNSNGSLKTYVDAWNEALPSRKVDLADFQAGTRLPAMDNEKFQARYREAFTAAAEMAKSSRKDTGWLQFSWMLSFNGKTGRGNWVQFLENKTQANGIEQELERVRERIRKKKELADAEAPLGQTEARP